MGSQGKLGKDAGSVACCARERPRTPIQRRHAGPWAHGFAPGRSHSTPPLLNPAWSDTSVPCARIHLTGSEQAALLEASEACLPQKVFRKAYLTLPSAISRRSLV